MSAKGYTNKTNIENYIFQTIDATFDSQIDTWIEAIENFIDKTTDRNFIADTEASTRYYDGGGTDVIFIDDCVEVVSLTVDDEEIDEVDGSGDENWYLYPANTEYKNEIVSDYVRFTRGHKNVEVSAKWGFSVSVPADIKMATTILVAGLFQAFGNKMIQSETIGSYQVAYVNDQQWGDFARVKMILDSYKKMVL